ncbi:MAG: hypothetical protein JW772_05100 [Candidatus Diapherotrites archaeon]|nr:hypothetical protein [Candidatus Diapherotrites archaeon]
MAEEKKVPEKKIDNLNLVLGVVLFIFVYMALYFIGTANTPISESVQGIPVLEWVLPLPAVWDNPGQPIYQTSMMHLLIPVFGFWALFFLTMWIEKFFELGKYERTALPIVFVVFCLAAFYLAVYWMAAEKVALSGGSGEVAFNYWAELQNSAFYLFLVSGALGWVSLKIVERIKL